MPLRCGAAVGEGWKAAAAAQQADLEAASAEIGRLEAEVVAAETKHAGKEKEALQLSAQLETTRAMQGDEIEAIRQGAEQHWAEFNEEQQTLLTERCVTRNSN